MGRDRYDLLVIGRMGISGSGILEPTFGLGWAEVEGEGMDGIKPSREESQGREMEKRGVVKT